MKSLNTTYQFGLLFVVAFLVCSFFECKQTASANVFADSLMHETSSQKYPDQKRFLNSGKIPAFLYRIPGSCQNCYPGISDPGLDSTAAVKQALSRAALLHALSNPVEITFITDFYTQKIHQKQWEVYGHLFEMPLSVQQMKPDSVFINQFGEALVLAKPAKKIIAREKQVVLSGFIQEKTYAELSDFIYRFEVNQSKKKQFVMRMVNHNFSIESAVSGRIKESYPRYNFHYHENAEADSTWSTAGISTNSGLWPAFFGSIMKKMFFTVKNRADYEVGNLSDSYSVALSANLKRETGNTHFSIKYAGCDIFNNMLNPHLDFYLNLEKP